MRRHTEIGRVPVQAMGRLGKRGAGLSLVELAQGDLPWRGGAMIVGG